MTKSCPAKGKLAFISPTFPTIQQSLIRANARKHLPQAQGPQWGLDYPAAAVCSVFLRCGPTRTRCRLPAPAFLRIFGRSLDTGDCYVRVIATGCHRWRLLITSFLISRPQSQHPR